MGRDRHTCAHTLAQAYCIIKQQCCLCGKTFELFVHIHHRQPRVQEYTCSIRNRHPSLFPRQGRGWKHNMNISACRGRWTVVDCPFTRSTSSGLVASSLKSDNLASQQTHNTEHVWHKYEQSREASTSCSSAGRSRLESHVSSSHFHHAAA